MRQATLVLALAGALAACSSSSGSSTPPPPGCDLSATYYGYYSTCYSDPAATSASCAADGGTWLPGGCQGGSALVGMCYETGGHVVYYYSTDFLYFASNNAGALCAGAGGTFVAIGVTETASCDFRPSPDMCADGSGTISDVEQAGYWDCTMSGGTLSTSACTTSGRVGTCSYVNDVGISVQERWYDATGQTSCTGTWTAG